MHVGTKPLNLTQKIVMAITSRACERSGSGKIFCSSSNVFLWHPLPSLRPTTPTPVNFFTPAPIDQESKLRFLDRPLVTVNFRFSRHCKQTEWRSSCHLLSRFSGWTEASKPRRKRISFFSHGQVSVWPGIRNNKGNGSLQLERQKLLRRGMSRTKRYVSVV